MFSDLECDYINPIDLCNKLNQVRAEQLRERQCQRGAGNVLLGGADADRASNSVCAGTADGQLPRAASAVAAAGLKPDACVAMSSRRVRRGEALLSRSRAFFGSARSPVALSVRLLRLVWSPVRHSATKAAGPKRCEGNGKLARKTRYFLRIVRQETSYIAGRSQAHRGSVLEEARSCSCLPSCDSHLRCVAC
jgi:hypothetical protein